MTVNKTTVREKKLLEKARDNYRLLKEQYLILQEEHEKLKFNLEQEYEQIENEKKNIYSEIEELKEYFSCLISGLEDEKFKREQHFEDFKDSTLDEIQKLYQGQLKELTDELASLDAIITENVNENEKLNKELFETKKQLSLFEMNKQSSETKLSQKYEKQIEDLTQKLKDFEKNDEKCQKLIAELELEKLEVASLKDEKNQILKQKQEFFAEKELELRKLREEHFKICQKQTDSEVNFQRVSLENETLKKSICASIDRERNLRNQLSQTERQKQESLSKIRQIEAKSDAQVHELTLQIEIQRNDFEKKIFEQSKELEKMRKQNAELHHFKIENDDLKQKLWQNSMEFQKNIQHLEMNFENEKHEFEKKMQEMLFEKNFAENKTENILSKSKTEQFLNEIKHLNQTLDEKDEEIVKLRSHYRSIISKMKRAIEKSDAKNYSDLS